MKILFVFGVFVGAIGAVSAFAEDSSGKAPMDGAGQLLSWTGFHVGVNGGYAWGKSKTTTTINDPGATNFSLASQRIYNVTMSPNLHPDGIIAGGQFGYNWQTSQFVLGVEADFQSFHLTDSKTAVVVPVTSSPLITRTSVGTDWLFTARARGGILFDHSLLYITGGVALTKLDYAQNNLFTICGTPGPTCSEIVSASRTLTGWTLGGGLDYGIDNNWSVRAEYLYVDFGGLKTHGRLAIPPPEEALGRPFNHAGHLAAHILRAAINYKL